MIEDENEPDEGIVPEEDNPSVPQAFSAEDSITEQEFSVDALEDEDEIEEQEVLEPETGDQDDWEKLSPLEQEESSEEEEVIEYVPPPLPDSPKSLSARRQWLASTMIKTCSCHLTISLISSCSRPPPSLIPSPFFMLALLPCFAT